MSDWRDWPTRPSSPVSSVTAMATHSKYDSDPPERGRSLSRRSSSRSSSGVLLTPPAGVASLDTPAPHLIRSSSRSSRRPSDVIQDGVAVSVILTEDEYKAILRYRLERDAAASRAGTPAAPAIVPRVISQARRVSRSPIYIERLRSRSRSPRHHQPVVSRPMQPPPVLGSFGGPSSRSLSECFATLRAHQPSPPPKPPIVILPPFPAPCVGTQVYSCSSTCSSPSRPHSLERRTPPIIIRERTPSPPLTLSPPRVTTHSGSPVPISMASPARSRSPSYERRSFSRSRSPDLRRPPILIGERARSRSPSLRLVSTYDEPPVRPPTTTLVISPLCTFSPRGRSRSRSRSRSRGSIPLPERDPRYYEQRSPTAIPVSIPARIPSPPRVATYGGPHVPIPITPHGRSRSRSRRSRSSPRRSVGPATVVEALPRLVGGSQIFPAPLYSAHPRFWHEDGNITVIVEQTEYKLHQYLFKNSIYFQRRGGIGRGTHLPLSDETKQDFDRLLSVLYPKDYTQHECKTVEEWASVLALAHKFEMHNIRQLAIDQLALCAGPVDKIALGQQYDVDEWLAPAYLMLAARQEPITSAEGAKLGVEALVRIGALKDEVSRNLAAYLDQDKFRELFAKKAAA